LLILTIVDRGVIATAAELFEARHYPGVVAMITDALEDEPECVPLLLIRARAHIALRRTLDAQADLRDVIRIDAGCGTAFRLLGELAARRDENASAATFFREALRLNPGDHEASDWLGIVESLRPAAVATQLPAPAAAAGRFSRPDSQPRFAKGTQSPDNHFERPTKPFARGSERAVTPPSMPLHVPPIAPTVELEPKPTLTGRPAAPTPAKPAPRISSRPITRQSMSELPGFGDYLVSSGILTRERLRAAQAYQRSMKVQLTTAIVTLGLATPQRIEWACVAHQSEVGQKRHQG
jgi:tetratricopeptide (TPR) repeat protein